MTSYEPQKPSSSPSNSPPINLLRGWPNPSLLPSELIRSAAETALSDSAISTPGLLYGPDPGYELLRESVARWLTTFYRNDEQEDAVTADRVCITGGASQNLGCILDVYTDPKETRCVWIVAPAYFLAFRIFEDKGLEMRAVPEDEEGVDVAFLKSEIEKVEKNAKEEDRTSGRQAKNGRSWAKVYKHIIYCVPTFANPSSRTMTLQRRKDLVDLAREFDALVVCDDVYDFLQWPSQTSSSSPKPLLKTAHLPRVVDIDRTLPNTSAKELDDFGNACSNGSFSKLAGPGLRVGWCEGTATFAHGLSQAGTTKSGGAPSQLTSTYVNLLLERGEMQRHIEEVLLPAYGRRYRGLMGAIERYLVPLGFSTPRPNEVMEDVAGGYFTWLTLPGVLSSGQYEDGSSPAEVLAQKCLAEENVTVAPGKIFEVPPASSDAGSGDGSSVAFANSIRLCWSWEDEEKLEEGIRRIARTAEAMIHEGNGETADGIRKGYVLVEKQGRVVASGA